MAFSHELFAVHDELRAHVAALQRDLRPGPSGVAEGATSAVGLRTRCLVLCRALRAHHQGEDTGTFPVLARAEPAVRDTIEGLLADHRFVADILDRIEALLAEAPESRGRPDEAVAREFDGLAAILTSHLSWEERTLAAVLDDVAARADDGTRARMAAALAGPWRDDLRTTLDQE